MKLWLKFIIGAVLGTVLALVLPPGNMSVESAVKFAAEIAVRFGRYMTIPVVFFTAVIAYNRLRETKLLFKTGFWTAASACVSTLILTVIGLLSILIVKLPRIPITVENITEPVSLNLPALIRSLFPYSAFEALNNGTFLLSAYMLALLVGTASTADSLMFKPVISLADSLSKLLYNIGVVFTEFLSVGMVAVLCSWTITYRKVIAGGVYTPLVIMLLVDFVIVAGIIYPLIIRYLCHDPHPYRILYASLCSVIAAFFSGDSNMVLLLNLRHSKESLGVRRRINGVVNPLFSVFAHGGSSLVTAVSFIVVWRSYSSLNIPFSVVLWILAASFCLSFLLGGFPSGGAFILLSVLCTLYGKGFENGFILLKPAAPIVCSFAAAFDALTAIFGSYIVGVKTRMVEHHGVKNFI